MSGKQPQDSSDFTQAKVWQDAVELAKKVYEVCLLLPQSEAYGISSQLKRAVISISTNFAEGYGRTSKKDKKHFYVIAYGSLLEVKSILYVANKLELIPEQAELHKYIDSIKIQLNAIRRSLSD